MLAPIEWSGPPVSVVSLGCGEKALLSDNALADLRQADLIYGSRHHFNEICEVESDARKVLFPSPLAALRDMLAANQSARIVVLGTGDALFYGIGSWLRQWLAEDNLRFHPNISSIQYCFHAIGLPWQQAEVISLHGRPLETLRRHIGHRRLLAVFTDQDSGPTAIATELQRQGYGRSVIWVCRTMGGTRQRIRQFSATGLAQLKPESGALPEPDALNVCIIEQRRDPEPTFPALPAFPGIADDFFLTGAEPGYGMISKRETRLTILSLMAPENGEIAWDIGAGCGSVSVEWARWNRLGKIYAIEQCAARIDLIGGNSRRFGTILNLIPVHGSAPASCAALPQPDSIFIGGSGGSGKLPALLDYAWEQLKPAGKLVASAVTEASVAALAAFFNDKPAREWITLQVEKNLPAEITTRTLRPVTIAKCIKH